MNGLTAGAWAVGALAGFGLALFIRRRNAAPEDPEAKLRELIGPEGMAQRDRNRAEAERERRDPP